MNNLFKILLTAALLNFITACSDDKIETARSPIGQAVVAKVEKTSPRFEKILKQVPADTSYLFANKKVLKGKVLQAHLDRTQQYLSLLVQTLDEAKTDAELTKMDRFPFFIKALVESMGDKLKVDNNASGLKLDSHNLVYGYPLFPVLRVELSDKPALLAIIKEAQEKSNYDLSWGQCGKYECLTDDDDKIGFAIVLLDEQLAVSIFKVENKKSVISHLTGEKAPKLSFTSANWNSFLAKNRYQGYGDGFIDLASFYALVEKNLLSQSESKLKSAGKSLDTLASEKACSALVKKHLDNVKTLVFGITELTEDKLSYESVLETNKSITTAFKAIPNTLLNYKVADNAIVDFGLNLNFSKLKEALTSYTNFLISENESIQCDAIKPAVLRKMIGSMSMASMFGADQFKSLYFAGNNIEFTTEGDPKNIDIFAAVGADKPATLIQMLAMLDPKFATLKLPEDGSAIKVPAELLQNSKIPGIAPEVFISAVDQRLNIMVGNKTQKMKAFKADLPTLFWGSMDGKRYVKVITSIMERSSKELSSESMKKQINAIKSMGGLLGKSEQRLVVDDRGLVWQYQMSW